MWPVATHVARSLVLCLCWALSWAVQNGWTGRGTVWGCTLAPTGDCNWRIHTRWQCSLISYYCNHLLLFWAMCDGYSQSTYILWLKSKSFASNMLVIFTGTSCFKLASSFVDNFGVIFMGFFPCFDILKLLDEDSAVHSICLQDNRHRVLLCN